MMDRPGLATEVVDASVYERAVRASASSASSCRPSPSWPTRSIPASIADGDADPDAPDPRNLFRVHWHNADDRADAWPCPPTSCCRQS
jgi:cysteine synthase